MLDGGYKFVNFTRAIPNCSDCDSGEDINVNGAYAGVGLGLRTNSGLVTLHYRQGFGDELAPQAGRDVAADERRFDRNRARAAKGVGQHAARPPETELHQHGRERLAELRLGYQLAIAALVQPDARRIQRQRRHIVAEADLDRTPRAALGQHLNTMRLLQPLDDRPLYEPLAGRNAR